MVSSIKEKIVSDLQEKFKQCPNVILTEYQGMSVQELYELRTKLRTVQSEYKVLKNRLTKIALKKLGFESLIEYFAGPVGVLFQHGDPLVACKILTQFIKEHEKCKLKSGLFNGKLISVAEIQTLSKLPSRQKLLERLASTIQSPIYAFACVLQASLTSLATILQNVAKQKEK